MLHSFDGHCFPIDNEILNLLRENGIVDEQTSLEEAQRFVEHHLKAEECYDFFAALRQELMQEGKGKRKK